MAIVGRNLYDNGVKVNSTLIPVGSSYTLTGLASDSAHPLTATNVDGAGNESAPSAVFAFTTPEYAPPPAESPLSPTDVAAIDAIVAQEVSHPKHTIPGCIIGITGPRGYLYKAYGTVSPYGLGARALTVDDHFRMGSDTKTFTAMAFWQAVDDGLVSLSDTLETYVPGVPNGDIITLEQVITMRSGVYEYTSNLGVLMTILLFPTSAYSQAQALALIKGNPSQFTPGSKYAYANSNAILIRAVVEAVRPGRNFPDILKEDVFDPLGLTETAWPTTVSIPAPAASSGQFNVELAGAAGALTTTIGDLTKWAQAVRDGTLLSTASHNAWNGTFPSTGIANPGTHPPDTFSYGHFLFEFGELHGHDGSVSGFSCACAFDPVTGFTVVVSLNQAGNKAFYTILRNIVAYLYPASVGL